MSDRPKTIQLESGSELSRLLKEAAETESVFEANGARYRVSRVEAPVPTNGGPRRRKHLEPRRVMNIIGLGASEGGSDIANLKDQYIADAANQRGE